MASLGFKLSMKLRRCFYFSNNNYEHPYCVTQGQKLLNRSLFVDSNGIQSDNRINKKSHVSVKVNEGFRSIHIFLLHPAESSENTSICAKIRKYVPIDCLWRMFS